MGVERRGDARCRRIAPGIANRIAAGTVADQIG
jgi:hypothetical protein